MKHEPWSKTHTATWCAHGANHRRWKSSLKWNFQNLRRCTTINNPHAHKNDREPLQTTMNNKIRIQLVRGTKPITTNKNTRQSAQEQTRSTIKKHTDTGTQRFRLRKWCQNNITNRSRRNHLRNCLRKKTSRSDYIIDTQTKTQWPKNYFAKLWQTKPSHAQLVFDRDHTCTHDTTEQPDNKSTNTNRVPLKNKMPEMVDSNLRFTERNSHVTIEFRRNRGSNELLDKDTTWKNNHAPPQQPQYKWQQNRSHHEIQKIWCLRISLNIMASWWCT